MTTNESSALWRGRGPEVAGTGLDSAEIDAVKGILMVCIAAGHSAMIKTAVPGSFAFLYAFHVAGFLILPFLFPIQPLSAALARDRAVRYLVPYLVFCALCVVLYPLVGGVERAPSDLLGVFIGSAQAIKAAAGLELYWFLPCLFSLTLLRALRARLSPHSRWLLLALALAVNATLGWVPLPLRPYAPFGLATAFFIYPLGLAAAWLWQQGRQRRLVTAAGALAVWFSCAAVTHGLDASVNMGRLQVYTIGRPLLWGLYDLIPVAAFLAFCALAPVLVRLPWLCLLGRYSLTVYLVHSLVYRALLLALGLGPRDGGLGLGIALLLVTLAISAAVAIAIDRVSLLRRLILPRDAAEWPPLAGRR